MISWFPMDEPLRSGNRPEPQHWNSDESTDVEETSAEEDQDWNDDSDADWTIDSEGLSFWRKCVRTGGVCHGFPFVKWSAEFCLLEFASSSLSLTWLPPAATNFSVPRVESYRDLFSKPSLWQRWNQSKLALGRSRPSLAIIDCIPNPSAAPVTTAQCSASAVLSARVACVLE